jgi:phosphate transport system substrate-binding protein
MKKPLLVATLLAAILILLAWGRVAGLVPGDTAADTGPAGRLRVTGSGTMAPLVEAMARRFEALHPRVRIEVLAGGTARGLSDLRQGTADVGMVSRPLGADEQDLRGLAIARDGVALVVHRDNPVTALNHAQVVGIYSGQLRNWNEVGGHDAPILRVAAAPGRSSTELFARHFGLPPARFRVELTEGENAARLRVLREHPNAVLYMSIGEAERSLQAGAPLRLLPDDGVPATSRNVARGEYPLARPLMLVTGPAPGALARAFIELCASSLVTDLVLALDFVPFPQ